MHSFSFNGIRKSFVYCEDDGHQHSAFAPIARKLLTVPGMDGSYLQGKDTQVRVIKQKIFFEDNSIFDLRKIEEEIADWLITNEPKELIFDYEPDRVYFAVVDGSLDIEEFMNVGEGVITFICPNTYKYGQENPFVASSDNFKITNLGTAEAEPIFEFEVLAPITFLMIQNQLGEWNMIGKPVDVENNTPYRKYELILNDNMTSTAGWTTAATGNIDGVIAGSIESNGSRFQPVSFGSGSGWHGPAIKTSLAEVLTDFRLETTIDFLNASVNIVGRVEVYLLDELDNVVGKVSIKDTQKSDSLAWCEARVGDSAVNYHMINEYGDQKGNWNDFYGVLRMERNEHNWYAYIAIVDQTTGKHHTRRSVEWSDDGNQFTRNVAQVVVHFGQFDSYATGSMGNYAVKVYKINRQPEGIPYIARTGDRIVFDHTNNGQVYINGEPYEDSILGADYFTLKKGENILSVLPTGSVETTGSYRNRYL